MWGHRGFSLLLAITRLTMLGIVSLGFVHQTQASVGHYEAYEVSLTSSRTYANPFTDVSVNATFTHTTSGTNYVAHGFYDGSNTWRIRFAPPQVGEWTYRTISSDLTNSSLHDQSDSFIALSSAHKGFIRVNPADPHGLAYDDGTPFFFMGDTAYALPDITETTVQMYVHLRRSQNFNNTRVWFNPSLVLSADNNTFKVAEFQKMDRHMNFMLSNGLNVEIIMFCQEHYRRGMTQQQMQRYVKYIVSRYAGYRNVSLWTVSNEVEIYPDGVYPPAGVQDPGAYVWAGDMATYIKSLDPHKHIVSVHHFVETGVGAIWNMYFRGKTDIIQQQNHGDFSLTTFDNVKRDGDGLGIENGIYNDRAYGVPVINGEYGYEYYVDPDGQRCAPLGLRFTSKWQRKGAWRIMLSGGYLSAGYERTLKCPNIWQPGKEYTGAGNLSYAYNFMISLPFTQMTPRRDLVNSPNLALALEGQEYALFAGSGGNVALNLTGFPTVFTVRRLDPRTGIYADLASVTGGGIVTLVSPDSINDWVFHLKNTGVTPPNPDIQPPVRVTTLATSKKYANAITLTWTAVGDDGTLGTAAQYDVRYSVVPITDANWANASLATNEPVPLVAGTNQIYTVMGLSKSTKYYFAMKVIDDAGNTSTLSNVVNARTTAK